MEGYKNRKQNGVLTLIARCLCTPGLLKAMATELSNYKLDFVVVEECRLNRLGTEWQ
jgi:hypothetical protein